MGDSVGVAMVTRLGAMRRAWCGAEPAPPKRARSARRLTSIGAEKHQPHCEEPGRGQEIALTVPHAGKPAPAARSSPRHTRVPSSRRRARWPAWRRRTPTRPAAAAPGTLKRRRHQPRPCGRRITRPSGTAATVRRAAQGREVDGERSAFAPRSAPKITMPAASRPSSDRKTGDARRHRGVGKDDLEPDEEESGAPPPAIPDAGRIRQPRERDRGHPRRAPRQRVGPVEERAPGSSAGQILPRHAAMREKPHPPDDPDKGGRRILHGVRVRRAPRDHQDEERQPDQPAAPAPRERSAQWNIEPGSRGARGAARCGERGGGEGQRHRRGPRRPRSRRGAAGDRMLARAMRLRRPREPS